jgi:hypothetical protein
MTSESHEKSVNIARHPGWRYHRKPLVLTRRFSAFSAAIC